MICCYAKICQWLLSKHLSYGFIYSYLVSKYFLSCIPECFLSFYNSGDYKEGTWSNRKPSTIHVGASKRTEDNLFCSEDASIKHAFQTSLQIYITDHSGVKLLHCHEYLSLRHIFLIKKNILGMKKQRNAIVYNSKLKYETEQNLGRLSVFAPNLPWFFGARVALPFQVRLLSTRNTSNWLTFIKNPC